MSLTPLPTIRGFSPGGGDTLYETRAAARYEAAIRNLNDPVDDQAIYAIPTSVSFLPRPMAPIIRILWQMTAFI